MAVRTRNWQVIGYPESLRLGWLDVLQSKGIQALISPLHDKDVFKNDSGENKKGDLKKSHYHIVFIFDSVKSVSQVKELVAEIYQDGKAVLPIAVLNLRSSIRYLIHKDDKDKAQYDVNDIINIGGVDLDKYLVNDVEKETDINTKFNEIFHLINDFSLTSFTDLAACLLSTDDELFSVFRKNAYFFSQIMKDRQYLKVNNNLQKKTLPYEK